MSLPFRVATLLFAFHEDGRVLLMHRRRPPNQGLWSPCGGKLLVDCGESPYQCARREAGEEMKVALTNGDLHLTGLVTEKGYLGQAHWMIFIFEILKRFKHLPEDHEEGGFGFFSRDELAGLAIPHSDREWIWPLFWQHRGGFFSSACECLSDVDYRWEVEDSRVKGVS